MAAQDNPYAPPTAEVADITGSDPQAETIRREHIKHEASIKSVGIIYYLGGTLMGGLAILFMFGFADTSLGISGLGGWPYRGTHDTVRQSLQTSCVTRRRAPARVSSRR